MTAMILDSRHSIHFGLDVGALKTGRIKSAPPPDNAPIRSPLVCHWHRAADGQVICTWTHDPFVPTDTRPAWWLGMEDDDDLALPRSRRPLRTAGLAIIVLLASAALGTFMCFALEPGRVL